MGCWNKTCALTGLHIRHGEKVLVFVLEKNTDVTDRCYTTSFWHPLIVPFYSEYNDYGGGENSSGVGLPLILDNIKKQMVEREQGDNSCHDIPVTAADFDEDMFFESVHESRLAIKARYGIGRDPVDIDFAMIRKDAVDLLLKGWRQEQYVGNGAGTQGWENNYIEYCFDDIVADSKVWLDMCAESIAERNEQFAAGDRKACQQAALQHMHNVNGEFEDGSKNLAAVYLRADNYRYSSILRAKDTVLELLEQGDRPGARALLTDALVGFHIDAFMESTRKNWHPGGHEGSQNDDHGGYRMLCKITNELLDIESAERDDDGEDDSESDNAE